MAKTLERLGWWLMGRPWRENRVRRTYRLGSTIYNHDWHDLLSWRHWRWVFTYDPLREKP